VHSVALGGGKRCSDQDCLSLESKADDDSFEAPAGRPEKRDSGSPYSRGHAVRGAIWLQWDTRPQHAPSAAVGNNEISLHGRGAGLVGAGSPRAARSIGLCRRRVETVVLAHVKAGRRSRRAVETSTLVVDQHGARPARCRYLAANDGVLGAVSAWARSRGRGEGPRRRAQAPQRAPASAQPVSAAAGEASATAGERVRTDPASWQRSLERHSRGTGELGERRRFSHGACNRTGAEVGQRSQRGVGLGRSSFRPLRAQSARRRRGRAWESLGDGSI
jgi:hypothetical protein